MAQNIVQYRPDVKTPIERFMIGMVVASSSIDKAPSASVFAFDREIVIEQPGGVSTGEAGNRITMKYASESYAHFEMGKTYLFALAGDRCLGYLEVQGDRLTLPDASSVPRDQFIAEHLGHPFPDYYGANDF
jgi:hypothetical protein